ncbi:MAG: PIN domain-containing protein [Tepidiformaceae bacterium]
MTSEAVLSPCLLDTNILLRIILKDNPAQWEAAIRLIEDAPSEALRLILMPTTVSELVYVLGGPKEGRSVAEVASALETVLALPIRIIDLSVIATAVELYRNHHSDWDDCVVAAYAIDRAGGRLASFDLGLDRIPGLARLAPGAA